MNTADLTEVLLMTFQDRENYLFILEEKARPFVEGKMADSLPPLPAIDLLQDVIILPE